MMNEINFLPESFLQRHQRRRRIMRELILVAVVTGAMVVWIGGTKRKASQLENYVQQKQQELAASEAQITELARLQKNESELNMQLAMQQKLGIPVAHSQMLALLGELMPEEIALTRVEMTADAPEPTVKKTTSSKRKKKSSKKDDDKPKTPVIEPRLMEFEIEGLSPSDMAVANFVGQLSEHPLFQDVKMKYTRQTKVNSVIARRFEIELRVDLNRRYVPAEEESGGFASAN